MSVQSAEAPVMSREEAAGRYYSEYIVAPSSEKWCTMYHWVGGLNLIHGAAWDTYKNAPEGRAGDSAVGSIISYLSRHADLMGKVPHSAVGHKMNEMLNWGKPGVEDPKENEPQHVFLSGNDFKVTGSTLSLSGVGVLPLELDPVSAELTPVMVEVFGFVHDSSDDDSEGTCTVRVHYAPIPLPTNVIPIVRL